MRQVLRGRWLSYKSAKGKITPPTGDLVLSTAIPDRVATVPGTGSPGGFYGGRVVTIPPEKKKRRPRPGERIAEVGRKAIVSRAPELKVTSPPMTLEMAINLQMELKKEIVDARNQLFAEINTVVQAITLREDTRARDRLTLIQAVLKQIREEKEQQEQVDKDLLMQLLLLMIE